MGWWDQSSTADFVAGIVVGICLMLFSSFWVLCAARRERERVRVMSRLDDKLAIAAGIAPAVTADMEKEADALIARKGQIQERMKQAFAPHHAVLDMRMRQLDQVEDKLQIMENADPLADSGDTSEHKQVDKLLEDAVANAVTPVPLNPGSTGAVEPGPAIGADVR